MWSSAGSRNLSGPIQRNQPTPNSGQQSGGQDDLFSPVSSRLPSSQQGSFRFGNQGNAPASSQVPPSSVEEFPPLNRTANGEIGSERGASLMASLGFASQNGGSSLPLQTNRGNGLLNALSANSRANEARSPPGVGAPGKRLGSEDDGRRKSGPSREELGDLSPGTDGAQGPESRNPLGAIGNDGSIGNLQDEETSTPEAVDPLEGMAAVDKWGIKGLRTLMNNYPDYHAMVVGIDPNSLGLDMGSQE